MRSPLHARARRRRTLAALALATAAGLLAGCSDDGTPQETSTAAQVSCPSPAAPAASAEQRTLTTPDGERSYHVWTPTGYDGSTPVPLVVDYHGTGGEALRYSTTFSGMVRDGLDRGYLVVAPQAASTVWSAPGYPAVADDVAFTRQLIDELSATYCVDPTRMYASGFSLGGGFTQYVSCVLDVWAAVAPESGVNYVRPCPDRPATPAIVWHGTADGPAPYGDESVVSEDAAVPGENYVGNVPYVVDQWALRNGCEPQRIDTEVAADVTRRTYACPEGAEVELYRHAGGHTLPGSIPLDAAAIEFRGPQVMSVNAPTVTLDFFDAHRRTTPPATAPAPTDSNGFPVG